MSNVKRLQKGPQPSTRQQADEPVEEAAASGNSHRPYFVVIKDATTGEYHHPHVHYIFEDDEPELLTNAVLESAEYETIDTMKPYSNRTPGRERLIVVDMSTDGQEPPSARSLTSEWQAARVTLSSAPTFEQGVETGTMMTIEGQSNSQTQHATPYDEVSDAVNGSNTFDRISSLGKKLKALASEYDREVEALKNLSHQSLSGA